MYVQLYTLGADMHASRNLDWLQMYSISSDVRLYRLFRKQTSIIWIEMVNDKLIFEVSSINLHVNQRARQNFA
jgi:hypothetical protein